jgi:hypothetical protein
MVSIFSESEFTDLTPSSVRQKELGPPFNWSAIYNLPTLFLHKLEQ